MKRILRILILTLAGALLLIGCSSVASPPVPGSSGSEAPGTADATGISEPRKTALTMALSVDPDGLDPHRTVSASTFQITNNIYDTLLKVDASGALLPGLAESWEFSKDKLSVTFKLRKGIAFHNGRPFTSEDVKFSLERLKDAESPRAADYSNIIDIRPLDENTIVLTTEKLDVALLTSLAYPWSAIVCRDAASALKTDPIGTGPYTLKEWVPQQQLILEKYEDYYGEARLETLYFKAMPDATAQISAFTSGELDIISITGDQMPVFEKNPDYNVIKTPMNSIQLMAMNLENEYLKDDRVRRAINYAVDKDSLINTVWWGYGEKIGSHYPTVLKEYVDTTDLYTYDAERAKSLIKEAGYEDGINLRMALPKNYTAYVNAGQVIANQLKEIGITCDIEIVEWAAWLSDVYNGREYDLTVVGHTGRLDPYILLARYASVSKENYFNYSNKRVDEILDLVTQETEEAKRTEMYQELQYILAEEVPALYIQSPMSLVVTQGDVAGFATYPIDIYEMKDVYFENR